MGTEGRNEGGYWQILLRREEGRAVEELGKDRTNLERRWKSSNE